MEKMLILIQTHLLQLVVNLFTFLRMIGGLVMGKSPMVEGVFRDGRTELLAAVLPDHVLELVVERLCLPDLFRFGLVCKSWTSVCDPLQFRDHLPWLIVPLTNNESGSSMAFENTENIGFFSLRDHKIYKAELPELFDRRICGSFPGGWLMTVHENSEIQLFNPFITTKSRSSLIHLPPMTKFPRLLHIKYHKEELCYVGTRFDRPGQKCFFPSKEVRDTYIHKVAISSSSSISTGTIIMAIQGQEHSLVFYRIGEGPQVWTPATPDKMWFFRDVTYYKGKFYAVQHNGNVLVVNGLDETSLSLPSVEQIVCDSRVKGYVELYILESSGDLLIVFRSSEVDDNPNISQEVKHRQLHRKTVGFKVLKLDFGTPNKWVEVESLGDHSLFLGLNSSLSIPSVKFSGCKPNCIYFTDESWMHFYANKFGGHDFGIFSLEDGSVEKYLYPSDKLLVMPPPVWFAPNLPS